MDSASTVWTRRDLRAQIAAMGVSPGDAVMVHASLRSVGRILSGPDALIAAILDAVGPGGTLHCYTDWEEGFLDLADDRGRVPDALRDEILPFDPSASRASRSHGAIAEMIRTWPGARRSGNPGASCAAVGRRADWFVADHPLDYGYGTRSPFARLVEGRGKVLTIGAPLDTLSILHHAEHLANIPHKRRRRYDAPLLVNGLTVWHTIEEFDTADPIVDGLDENYFADIAEAFLSHGTGTRGLIGSAPSALFPAADLVAFAVQWLEARCA
jgi:aminoglycoside 3-N-acetyltransferase